MRHLLLSLFLLPSLSAFALDATLNPTADAFLSANNAANNYGGAGALAVSPANATNGEFDSLVRFTLASAKATFDTAFGAGGWVITGATLTLTQNSNPGNALFNANAAGNFTVHWLGNDTWTEGTGNPNTPQATGINYNGLSALRTTEADLGTFTLGSTPYVLTLNPSFVADLTGDTMSTLLLLPSGTAGSSVVFSRTGATPPVLTLSAQAVPEPASLGLLGAGAAGLGLARKRRHARTA